MNKEYLSAKAELCSNLAVEQINNGDEEEGVKNLKRMIRAFNEIHLLNIEEEKQNMSKVRGFIIFDRVTGKKFATLPLTIPIGATVDAYKRAGHDVSWGWEKGDE